MKRRKSDLGKSATAESRRRDASSGFNPEAFIWLAKAEEGHWWFNARNRLLIWALRRHVGEFQDLLEVGCGTGYVLSGIRQAIPAAALSGSEYHEEGLAFARQRVPDAQFRQLDARRMGESEKYDVIGAFDVIEHILEDELVLRNLARALRPGGSLILTVPQHQWLWSAVDENACHVRRYARRELVRKVEAAGLTVTYATSFVTLLLPLMLLSRIRARSKDYDPASEFRIPGWVNRSLERVMAIERWLIQRGLRLPAGGSLLLIATSP